MATTATTATAGMATAARCRIVVMCSGNGSNLQALIDAIAAGRICQAEIVRVVVNRKTAYAIKRAELAHIPADYFNMVKEGFQAAGEKDPDKLRDARARYDAALAQRVLGYTPDLVVLAGWMAVFTPHFLTPLEARGVKIINLHPALPGAYDGANAIARAYQDFQAGKLQRNVTGVMVHEVIAEVDRGTPILTREVECREDESLEQLEQRIHAIEHGLLVEATALVVTRIAASQGR